MIKICFFFLSLTQRPTFSGGVVTVNPHIIQFYSLAVVITSHLVSSHSPHHQSRCVNLFSHSTQTQSSGGDVGHEEAVQRSLIHLLPVDFHSGPSQT